MNKVILCGRLTKDPDVSWTNGQEQMCIARYTIAVDRRGQKREGEQSADFISCVAFRKNAEFTEKYMKKGTKIILTGHLVTGSYTDKDGRKIYTTEVNVEESEFAESKGSQTAQKTESDPEGFMQIPDILEDDGLPFN